MSAYTTPDMPTCMCGHALNDHDFDTPDTVPCWLCGCADLTFDFERAPR